MTELRIPENTPSTFHMNAGELIVERLTETAKLPVKAHDGDLGYDIFADEEVRLEPNQRALISTGIRVKFPYGYGGQFFDRSSMASNRGLVIYAGTIDNGYRGELKVLIHNISEDVKIILRGEKITQMVPMEVSTFTIVEGKVSTVETSRAEAGFGSSGA